MKRQQEAERLSWAGLEGVSWASGWSLGGAERIGRGAQNCNNLALWFHTSVAD